MVTFRQLFDPRTSSYTYLLADDGQAVLIDPVFEQVERDQALLGELDVALVTTLETHVHADHVTGAWLHKTRTGSAIALSRASGAKGADLELEHGDRVRFGGRFLEARATPGHTGGCMTYVLDGHGMAFTGDALLIRGSGRTDFQEGDSCTLYRSVHEQIFTLPEACQLWPGHDYKGRTMTTVGEEKRHNPRLGGRKSAEEFACLMQNLALAPPRHIDVAVPANLHCGRTHPVAE